MPVTSSTHVIAVADFLKFLNSLDEDRLGILLGALLLCLVALVFIVGIICRAIVVHRRNRMEMELKREMMDRGATFEEVTELMAAGRPASKEKQALKPQKS